MGEWKQKRFWTEAHTAEQEGGFAVLLDGRQVKTPAKTPLIVPTQELGSLIAAEWDAQEGEVNPETMPMTRAANAALDKVTPQFDEVAALLAAYGESDLLCYRANAPEELIARQAAVWDPLLEWAAQKFDARLSIGHGVMFIDQDTQSVDRLKAQVFALTPFQLTAFHDLVAMSGSLVLALAAIHDHMEIGDVWETSRVDETWQSEQWGKDDEAEEIADKKRASFEDAMRFFKALG